MLLAPTNDAVDGVNELLVKKIPGAAREYKLVDMLRNAEEVVNYPGKFCNSLETSGFPQEILKITTGTSITCS